MKRNNNKIVLDLAKCQWAEFWYVNQYGQTNSLKPYFDTVRMYVVTSEELAFYHPEHPGESTLARARRLNLIDVWVPVVQFQLTANHSVSYTGKKAVSMWEAWKAKIYGGNK